MQRCLAVVLAVAVWVAPAVAAPPALKPLAQRIVDAGAPGAVVYTRNGSGARAAAAGRADLKRKVALKPGMTFRVGSITKSFVAVVVLQLVAEGKLELDDTVEQWLPGALPNGTAITLRHLLNHTSGVPNYTANNAFLSESNADRARVWTPLELLAAAAGAPDFAPGSSWAYSNTNYVLLALVVEAASGHAIAQELQTRILTPLNLSHTTFPLSAAMPSPFAHGYLPGPTGAKVDVTDWNPSYAWAAGALVSNAGDLARFYSALVGGRLLAPAQQAELHRTTPAAAGNEYGLGIIKERFSCRRDGWGHTGGIWGYTSAAFASPDGSHVAVVLVNGGLTRARAAVAFENAFARAFCDR